MTSNSELGLLTSRDAGPLEVINRDGGSLFLLLGDHAGNRVPERLRNLGLAAADLDRHIALDLGVEALGRSLSLALGAPFVMQRYSRLVIDCNRALSHPDSIATASDGTPIPGNIGVSADQRLARASAIHDPYHQAIASLLAQRDTQGLATIVVSLHSFTPSLAGVPRPWEVGVLHGGGNEAFALAVLSELQRCDFVVGDNVPYRLDATDFTVPRHAFASGRPYVELELRQDALATGQNVGKMAANLERALRAAATRTAI
jgi:predicted N-formylglutamate amidohydrolase